MYALDIVGRSTKTLLTVVSNQASKVIFPAQIAGAARFGVVACVGVLWVTHPYGVSDEMDLRIGWKSKCLRKFLGEFY